MKSYKYVSWILLLLILCITSLSCVILGTNYTQANATTDVIYHGNTNSNNVSLMINVYWGNEYIDGILDCFASNNIKTTFFVGGMWVNKYPDILQKIVDGGHEIANHGYFHKDQDKLNYKQNYDEIYVTHKLVKSCTGIDMTLFAPPSGAYSKVTIQSATDLGYSVIMWTHDTIDWRDKDTDKIFSRATKNISGGDLILCHPTYNTLLALPKIIEYALKNGYNLTTVTNTCNAI